MKTTTVLFICHKCGLQRVRCDVQSRMSGEDVVKWTEKMNRQVFAKHAALSPSCDPRTGKRDSMGQETSSLDIAVPVPQSGGIGEPAPLKGELGSDFMKSRGAN